MYFIILGNFIEFTTEIQIEKKTKKKSSRENHVSWMHNSDKPTREAQIIPFQWSRELQ